MNEVEDYWKHAEQMLDDHYNKKKRNKLLFLLLFLFTIGVGGLYYQQTHHTINKTTLINTGINEQENKSSTTTNAAEKYGNTSSINQEDNDLKNKKSNLKNKIASQEIIEKPISASDNQNILQQQFNQIVEPEKQFNQIVEPEKQLEYTSSNNLDFISPYSYSLPIALEEKELSLIEKERIKDSKHTKYHLTGYIGALKNENYLSGPGILQTIERREKEELPSISLQSSISVGKKYEHFEINIGISYNTLSQKVKYSSLAIGDYYNNYGDWQPYQYTILDQDSAYISGVLFIQNNYITVNDSTFVIVTDTLVGPYQNPAISAKNGERKITSIGLPFDIAYLKCANRFTYGIGLNLTPSFIVNTNGAIINNEQNAVATYNKKDITKLYLSGAIFGQVGYNLGSFTTLMLRPRIQKTLTKIKETDRPNNNYTSYGFELGLRYWIK